VVTPLCPLCRGVSKMNSRWHKANLKTKLCMYVSLTTEVMAIFVIFLAYFGQNLVALATSLRPGNQKCLLWNGRPRKPPVIGNHILVISSRNAFMCIYSNFCPKVSWHGNAPLSLVFGSVTHEFPDGTNPISKTNYAWMCCIQLKLWPFV